MKKRLFHFLCHGAACLRDKQSTVSREHMNFKIWGVEIISTLGTRFLFLVLETCQGIDDGAHVVGEREQQVLVAACFH